MDGLPLLEARLFNVPLLAEESRAISVAKAFGKRLTGHNVIFDADMSTLDERMRKSGHVRDDIIRMGPVALVEAEGALVNKGSWLGESCGMTSYEGISAQVREIASEQSTKAAVFEIDSFGGEVDGCFACAEEIYRLSLVKPTIAILTDHACSAAYALASQCRSIVMPSTGFAGSIGVISLHADYSKQLENEGIKVTILRSAPKKARPTPFEPMLDEDYNETIAEFGEIAAEFAAMVERGRGGRISAEAALATEAAVFRGQKAVAAGLADAVGIPADAFAQFCAEFNF